MPHTLTCQQCGKIFTVSISKKRAKVRQYCSRECANFGRRKPLHTCPVCGKQFRPYDRKATIYCSRECYHSTLSRKALTCKHCGQEFYNFKHYNQKYCNFDCYNATRTHPIGKACLYCGKPFSTVDYRRKYCDRICYDKDRENPSHYKSCEVCGMVFYDNLGTRRFCSKKCRLEAGWMNRDPSKRDTFTCEWCSKEFENWSYRQNRFCSMQCTSEFAARQPKPNARKPEIHITLNCEYCGKPYETTTHQVRLRGSRFCSIECRGAMWSIEARGENNPNWAGGSVDPDAYGPNWGRQKRRAKKRDKKTCQVCGYQVGGDRYLDVHHIIPIKQFDGDWQKANRLKNLISLCRQCHVKVEKGKLPCPKPLAKVA